MDRFGVPITWGITSRLSSDMTRTNLFDFGEDPNPDPDPMCVFCFSDSSPLNDRAKTNI